MKKAYATLEQIQKIAETYDTPFYLYDEKGIRENARKVQKAFSWNKGFKEYFAVKACPNPSILKILKEEGCGTDCSSLTELQMSDACGFSGSRFFPCSIRFGAFPAAGRSSRETLRSSFS